MKILITGSRGFVGTHLRLALPPSVQVIECDAFEERVHGPDPDADIPHPYEAGWIPPEGFADVDVVIHLGAQVGVADSMTDPWRYAADNSYDTLSFLESLKDSNARPKKIIVASSMSVYGDPRTSDPISEDHPVRPASVYGLTKFDQESLVRIYGDMLGVPTVALRFFNIYGEGQALSNPYTGVLAIFASALMRGEAPRVFEDGQQTRDFIYVGDVVSAIMGAAIDPTIEGVFNVSTGRATTIEDVALKVADALEIPIPPDVLHEARPGDIRHCIGDSEALRSALRTRSIPWEPRSLEAGLEAYVDGLRTGIKSPATLWDARRRRA